MCNKAYLKDNQSDAESQNYLNYSALADEIFRAGINYNFYAGYGAYLGYNQIKYSDNQYKLLSANLSGSLNKNWGFYTSAYKDYENHKDYGIYFALRYTPSNKFNAITSVSSDSGRLSYRQEIFGLSDPQIGSFGWGGYVERDQDNHDNNASIYALTVPVLLIWQVAITELEITIRLHFRQRVFGSCSRTLCPMKLEMDMLLSPMRARKAKS